MATRCKYNKQYHFTYYTINLINNKIYYGVHNTNDLNDNYLGSGKLLNRAIKKYGINHFKRIIDKFFDNEEDAYNYESRIVNEEFIKSENNYNICDGGRGGWKHMLNKTVAKDKDGNVHCINVDDPRIISGELVHINLGRIISEKTKIKISKSNTGKNKGKKRSKEIKKHWSDLRKGKIAVENKNGDRFLTDINDKRFKTGEIQRFIKYNNNHTKESKEKISKKLKNTTTATDINGNNFRISIDSKEYKSGKYKSISADRIHIFNIKTTKGKMVYIEQWKNKYSKNENWILGRNFKNINIYNIELGLRKIIKENEWNEYKSNGWKLGMGKDKYKKIHIHNSMNKKKKMIYGYELKRYLNLGWKIGRGNL